MKKYILYTLAAVVVISQGMAAQMKRNFNPHPAMDRIESFKKVRMMETMKLDETMSVKLFARYNAHQDRIKELEREGNDIYDKLESQIQSNASESEYSQTFSTLREYEKKWGEERVRYFNELKDLLTPKQLAEYMVFERNFSRDLREAVRNVKMDRLKNH
ncbi:MAG TPA: hypothetical protein VK470_05295 [Bacteroidota bacterium]|nr:hypothetical protein [Bacteroidota bacterium]